MRSMKSTPRYKILIVDDETAIADLVAGIFKAEGMSTFAVYRPEDALEKVQSEPYDLAIVDVMMPGMDGFELCRQLHSRGIQIPIIFLTAKDEETDIVVGFALGAEDYVTKPFKPRELVARVKARLRRQEPGCQKVAERGPSDSLLSVRGIEVDSKAHAASLHDIPLSLTPKEFGIFELLLRRAGEPVSAKELYETAWEEEANATSANTIMVHIRHLRQKLAEIDSSEQFIETAWGVGYRIAKR